MVCACEVKGLRADLQVFLFQQGERSTGTFNPKVARSRPALWRRLWKVLFSCAGPTRGIPAATIAG
jgi:hypothetical protein